MSQQTLDPHPFPTKLQQMLVGAGFALPEELFSVNLPKAIIVSSLGMVYSCGMFMLALFLTVASWSCEPASDGGWGCNVTAWSDHLWPANALLDALQVCWVLLFGLALTLCLRLLVQRYRQRYLCVYPWGLFVPPDLTFPWEQIQHIWRGSKESRSELAPRIRLDALRLQREDGKTFAFTRARWNRHNTEQRTALCDRIERECLRVHLPVLLGQFDRGERLSFGPLQVSRTGLVYQGWGEMAWEEVECFEGDEIAVHLQRKRKRKIKNDKK